MANTKLPRWNSVQWSMVTVLGLIAVLFIVSIVISSLPSGDDDVSGNDADTGIGDDVEISGTGCLATIVEAASIPADQDANESLIRSAYECRTVDEWVMAVKAHPEAMGQVDPAIIDPEYDLMGICGQAPQAPVCVDAARLGLDSYWAG